MVVDVDMGSKPQIMLLELTEDQFKQNQTMGAFAGIQIQYTNEDGLYKIEMTPEKYETYKKNCGKTKSFRHLSDLVLKL